MANVQAVRAFLVAVSRRHSRVAHEVEDLAHDLVLAALRRGLPVDGEAFLRGAHGAARRHGAFLARGAGRRRARELRAGEQLADVIDAADDAVDGAPLSVLSPALRTTLLLLCSGLEKAELRAALGVSDAALRKRFQALRARAPLARPELARPERTPARARLRRSQVALLPRLAGPLAGGHASRVLAATDPDGHGLIFTQALTRGRRTATSEASATDDRTRTQGSPCSTPRSRTSVSSSP